MRTVGRCSSFSTICAVTDSTSCAPLRRAGRRARASSVARISSAQRPQRGDRGTTSSDACHSRKRSASSATIRSARRGLAAAAGERLRDHRLEVVDVVEEAAVELVDRRVEVARNGEVDEEQRPALARAQRAGDRLARDDEARRARRRDDDVRGRARRRPRRGRAPARRAAGRAPRRGRASGSRRPRSRRRARRGSARSPRSSCPAPISSTRRPSSSPNTCCASAAAADGTDAGLSPIAVSTRTRRPAWSACRKTWSSSGPGAPASNALRTWPRISPSPGTSESSPAATRKRCSAAASSGSR